jgi:hypothetical protein
MNRTIFFSIFIAGILCTFSNCKKEKSECLTCPPLVDTTSHIVQWQAPDTLGAQGLIRDVWVFSSTNALAVGQIFLKDSSGQVDQSKPYIGAQWNGQKWKLLKLNYDIGGQISVLTQLKGIWVFGNSDYWLAGGSVFHWDGTSPQTQLVFSRLTLSDPNATIEKIWGISGAYIFGVGNAGTIVHFNGTSWTKMTSNTTVDLQDIWGIDATHIWATGTNVADGHCVVLQCNGTSWKTIYDSNTQPAQSQYQFGTLWTNTLSSLYLDGGSGTHKLTLSNLDFGLQIKTGLAYVGTRIRAGNQNDIYDVTTGGEVSHYNGSSWHIYPEIQALNNSGNSWTSVYPTSDFVLIGGWYLTAYNGAPIVIRGYR